MSDFYGLDHHALGLDFLLRGQRKGPRRGVKKLATHLRCHPTYLFKVLNQQYCLSVEQAAQVCQFFKLNETMTDFYIDLVSRDRAGSHEAKAVFAKRVQAVRDQRKKVTGRIGQAEAISLQAATYYYANWMPRAIHMVCLLDEPGINEDFIARKLNIPVATVLEVVMQLIEFGILARDQQGCLRSLRNNLHLPDDSPLKVQARLNSRYKMIDHLQNGRFDKFQTQYSAFLCISRAEAETIAKMGLDYIERTRKLAQSTKAEEVYILTLDFAEI